MKDEEKMIVVNTADNLLAKHGEFLDATFDARQTIKNLTINAKRLTSDELEHLLRITGELYAVQKNAEDLLNEFLDLVDQMKGDKQ